MSTPIVTNGKAPQQAPTPHALHTAGRLAAIYARVSSEEQRENQTIKTQIEAAKRWVEFQKLVEHPIDITEFYLDDGVSGTIALADRPAGKRLLDDAVHGKFALVLVYKIDRLGRDPRDILNATHRLDQLGVAVKSLTEEFDLSTPSGKFMFNVFAAAAGFARDSQLERMNEAKNHWAREGAWLGGVVPYGYSVVGKKKEARLVISDTPVPGLQLSEADVVRMIYRLLAEEGWSCDKIAEHVNALGVPTSYTILQRKVRRKSPEGTTATRSAGVWMYGRIRNLVVNPVYKGEHHYGRRTTKVREVIVRAVPAIVDADLWDRARQGLRRNMLMATRNAKRQYLLRGLITCGVCGLSFGGTRGAPTHAYYACNGTRPPRSRVHGKCPSKFIPAGQLEETIWQDILGFLHDPGPVLAQLAAQLQSRHVQTQDLEHERLTAALALSHKDAEKEQILTLYRRGRITGDDLERQLDTIAAEAAELQGRLSTLDTTLQGQEAIATRLHDAQHLLGTLRARLKADFTWDEKRELVEMLVLGIRVDGPGQITVTYAFDDRVATCTSQLLLHHHHKGPLQDL